MIKHLLCFLYLLIVLFVQCTPSPAQTAATAYYQFNGNLNQSVGTTPLTTGGPYTINAGGPVGQYLSLTSASSDYFNGQSISPSTGFCVQMLFRSGYNFTNTRNALMFTWGYQSVSFQYPNISFTTNNSPSLISDDLTVTMDGIGRKTWSYLTDGNWHHIAFNFNGSTGRKEIWIDGQLPTGFSKVTNTGNISIWVGAQTYRFNQSTSYVKIYGDLDEIAIYSTALTSNQIYQNYLDYKLGNHYTTTLAALVPAAASVAGTWNPLDFTPGSVIPTPGTVTLGASVTPLNQLYNFPVPRYKPGHTLRPIFNGGAPEYEGQRFQSGVSDAQATTNDTLIQKELCSNYNFYISVIGNFQNAEQVFSNDASNLGYKNSTVLLRIQRSPLITNQGLANDKYVQNSSGVLTDGLGNPTSGYKFWRPTTDYSFYNADGNSAKISIQAITNSQTNRPSNNKLNLILEDGEEIYTFSNKGLWTDPRIRDSVTTFGGGNYQTWYARKFCGVETVPYRDIMFSGMTSLTNCLYTYYALDGYNKDNEQAGTDITSTGIPARFVWSEARKINTFVGTKYYSTPDFYVLPQYWYQRQGVTTVDGHISLFHGWNWIPYCRQTEIPLGDDIYSPFVAAGWYGAEEKNTRPAQWLGLLKVMGVSGAETYYSSFFNLTNPLPNATNWIWQIPTPSLVQALSSRYEPLLRHSTLMTGDVPVDYSTGGNGYSFYAGDIQKLVVIRKDSTANKYVIAGNINPIVNTSANVPDSGLAVITLAGTTTSFYVRRQGSVYYFNNSVSPLIFYQLDKWHENTHPYYWTKDFYFEGEVNDTASAGFSTVTIRPNLAAGDFSSYTTYLKSNTANDSVQFKLKPRAAATYYLYVRAKSTDGTTTGFTAAMDFVSPLTINCITDTNWTWYRYQTGTSTAVTYSALSTATHTFTLKATAGKLAVDQVVLSTNNSLVVSPNVPCGAVTASITPSGSTTFCNGGSVILTANSATSYIWNTGSTSQAINVTISGTYTVTVTISASTASASATVTVLPLPTATITPSGATTFCSGSSVNLTASSNSSYLWSTAATTQTINVTTSGNYTVTVTGVNGCTKSSAVVTTTVKSAPTAAITAGGTTNFCSGGSVLLSTVTGVGYTYQWQRAAVNIAGATNNSYSAVISGNYTVVVTLSSCTATSNTIAVTVVSTPTTSNAGPDQSVCTDSTTLQGNIAASGTGAWTLISGTGTITTAASPISAVTALGVGANVFRWSITNTPCVPSTDDVTITRTGSSPVSITITANTNPFCSGATITFSALPVNGGSPTFQWKKNGVNVGTNSPTYAVAGVNGDLITCVLTSSLVCGTGSPATSNTVTESLSSVSATITPGGATTFCSGGSVLLSANTGSGLTYQWKNSGGNISGQTNSTYSATTTETYTVVVTNSNLCSATSSGTAVTVTAIPTAIITPSGSTAFCSGDSIQLASSASNSYLWNTGATTQNIYAKTSGSYVVTLTNVQGCTAVSPPVTIVVSNGGAVSITAIPSSAGCSGDIIKLKSSSTSNNAWSTGATSQTISVTSSNTYTVTITGGNGCTASSSILVSIVNCDSSCSTPTGETIVGTYHYSVVINWRDVPNASNYVVTITCASTPSCTKTVVFQGNQLQATIKGLTANTGYYFQIYSVCGDGVQSEPSTRLFFKTKKVCSGCAATSTEGD